MTSNQHPHGVSRGNSQFNRFLLKWGRNGRADALLVAVEKGVTMTQLEEEKTSGSGAAAMDMKLEVVVIAVSDIDH
jgi:hypothetical protein